MAPSTLHRGQSTARRPLLHEVSGLRGVGQPGGLSVTTRGTT